MKNATALFITFLAHVCCLQLQANEPATQKIWDLANLSQPPKAQWGETRDLVQEVYFQGEPYHGQPTRVFAYVGRPEGKGPFPGMVLVHGGGGQAFEDWARHWAKRGYAAIAMDTAGNGPAKKRLPDGGPDQDGATKFRNFMESETREMWTYHAVADVILAHSLLRSLPEVNAEKTAITGISWGGYLTCITAGVDSRFKAAVPVYGCGFLHDNSVWRDNQLAAMEPNSRRRWIARFDPGQHVGRTACPILFFNGTNDFAYPLDSYRKTIEQVKSELVTTAIHLKLRHGHIWTFGIVDAFIDSILRDGPALARVGEIRQFADKARAPILNKTKVVKAELLYTADQGPWQKREWKTLPGKVTNGGIEAVLPAEWPIAFYLQATDERGFKTSSTHADRVRPSGENHAIAPTPRLEQDFYDWHERHAEVLRIKDEIDPDIVLIGDSITHMWGGRPLEPDRADGADSWAELFGNRALNLGFGWDRTQNVLWRIDHGELDGLDPKTVVIHIGTNNLATTKNHAAGTPEQIAEGIEAVCQRVRAKLPKAKILLMAVFPRGEKPDHPMRVKIAHINARLRKIVENLDVTLVDLGPGLLDGDGRLSKATAPDFLHLSGRGYQIWADALKPHLAPFRPIAALGAMVGEVTPTSAFVQVRLCHPEGKVGREVRGAPGVVEFRLNTGQAVTVEAKPERDFIARAAFSGLKPGTAYRCFTRLGSSEKSLIAGPDTAFKTLPGPLSNEPVRFVVVTGMNYAKFHGDDRIDKAQHLIENNTALPQPYSGADKHLGYPALATILSLKPHFFVGTGDNVYYDTPDKPRAQTIPELRQKWHEQWIQPRYRDLFAAVPTYWMVDDHDYRIDDGDNTGDHLPTVGQARATMLEQLPLGAMGDLGALTYRTHRVSRDLQVWFPENRMYRSPNGEPDGPRKSIWGVVQKNWLKKTLAASDAKFKLLVSPTPMIGPDDRRKTDNHTNHGGFRHERDAFFAWLKETGLDQRHFYIVCGDRHWQYHSIHPTGIEEFSCGALIDANSRLGRKPGDPASTDPEGLIKQPYSQNPRSGGFLRIDVSGGTLTFTWQDEHGAVLHTTVKK